MMALKAQAPIVPVAIKGARDAMRKGSRWIQPVLVEVVFGEPIQTTGLAASTIVRLIAVRPRRGRTAVDIDRTRC